MSQDNKSNKQEVEPLGAEAFLEAIKQLSKGQQESLMTAISELRKPYLEPGQEQYKHEQKERAIAATADRKARREQAQANCSHQNPDKSEMTAIFWMPFKSVDGKLAWPKGVCNYCDALFELTEDPVKLAEYQNLLKKVNQKTTTLFYT